MNHALRELTAVIAAALADEIEAAGRSGATVEVRERISARAPHSASWTLPRSPAPDGVDALLGQIIGAEMADFARKSPRLL